MARVTIEKCLEMENNPFKLVVLASDRAREIACGARVAVDNKKNEKPAVVALREIEAGVLDIEELREKVVTKARRYQEQQEEIDDDPSSEIHHFMADEFKAVASSDLQEGFSDLLESDDSHGQDSEGDE